MQNHRKKLKNSMIFDYKEVAKLVNVKINPRPYQSQRQSTIFGQYDLEGFPL